MNLRRMTEADVSFANGLRHIAGWNQTERDWQGYLGYDPEGCFVAEVDGRPAGTATTIHYDGRFGWIGMVLVHPDFRRLGVGSALLHRAIARLKEAGVRSVKLDATPMGKKVYVPLGFVDEYELARYEGIAPVTDAVVMAEVAAFSSVDLEVITSVDAKAFGAERPDVLRSLSERNPELCFVVREGLGIAGFLIARHGANATQIGPWIARDEFTAEKLLRAFFHRAAGRRVFVDVVDPNAAAVALIRRQNFTVQRTLTRMFLGENAHPGEPALVFGISSPEKG